MSEKYEMSDRQQKLLRLALDPAAQEGEWRNAAVMFVASLRKDGINCDTFLFNMTRKTTPIVDHLLEYLMPFGKYKGQPLKQIPTTYLEWLLELDNLKDDTWKAVSYVLELREEQDT